MQEKQNQGWEPLQGEKRSAAENGGSWPLPFFVLQVELDSPMPPIGLESPSHSIRQPTCFFMLPCHPSMQVALGKMVALLKKPKLAKSECATAMTLALQAIKAGKPLKSSFNKALKA